MKMRGAAGEVAVVNEGDLFFAVEVIDFSHAEEFSLGLDLPLVGLGVKRAVGGEVVRDDEEHEIFGAGVGNLVGGAGRLGEGVAGFDDCLGAVAGADGGGAGEDDKELELLRVGVQRADGGAGRDAALLEIEGVSATPGTGVADATEGERDVFGEGVVFTGGGAAFGFGEGGDGDGFHGRGRMGIRNRN